MADVEELSQEPTRDNERSLVNDKHVSIWFEDQGDFYSGSVLYDMELIKELAKEQETAEKDDSGCPKHYLITFDDGDTQHSSWPGIQIGIRNFDSGASSTSPTNIPSRVVRSTPTRASSGRSTMPPRLTSLASPSPSFPS